MAKRIWCLLILVVTYINAKTQSLQTVSIFIQIIISLLDIDRLKNSVLTNRASLIKLKSQISCELSGVDKNNEDFKTKEKTKSDLLARVDDMIGFVKQTNDVIREYNQKAVKDSYVLRGKLQWSNYLI